MRFRPTFACKLALMTRLTQNISFHLFASGLTEATVQAIKGEESAGAVSAGVRSENDDKRCGTTSAVHHLPLQRLQMLHESPWLVLL